MKKYKEYDYDRPYYDDEDDTGGAVFCAVLLLIALVGGIIWAAVQ